MKARCKHCGANVTFTERESTQIAADLDRRFSWSEQASFVFEAVCSDCLEEEARRLLETDVHKRVVFISASV